MIIIIIIIAVVVIVFDMSGKVIFLKIAKLKLMNLQKTVQLRMNVTFVLQQAFSVFVPQTQLCIDLCQPESYSSSSFSPFSSW